MIPTSKFKFSFQELNKYLTVYLNTGNFFCFQINMSDLYKKISKKCNNHKNYQI